MAGMESSPALSRGTLVRWVGWFGLVNGFLAALIGLRYLLAYGMPESGIAVVYMTLAFVTQFAVLGFIPLMLLLALLVMLLPRKGLIIPLGVLLVACGLSIIILDTNIFAQYRYHLNGMTVAIFETSTWVFTGVIFLVLLGFQFMLADIIWKWVSARSNLRGVLLAFVLTLAWFGGQGIHIWADATAYSPVTSFTRYLPAYYPLKAKRRLASLGWVDPDKVEQQRLLRQADAPDSGQLAYPLSPLVCSAADAQLYDIVFVLVDALRPDKVTADFTPNIYALSQQGQNFRNHYSGGNSSRMGVFSMFYGLPSTYWQAFYDTQRQPLVMEQLLANNYEVAAFSAVGFGSPAQIDRTVFAGIGPADRFVPDVEGDLNHATTAAWRNWLVSRTDTTKPAFSFLYYDPGKSGAVNVAAVDELDSKYQSYLTGIAEIDKDVGLILTDLQAAGRLDDTLVIVASDHGYEFDELGLGYVGHASNYGPYQLRSTLVMHWPERPTQQFSHRSAHQDLPATFLQEVFACENPASDYSSGTNLFAAEDWDWIIAGSYNSHAIVEPDKLVITNPGGFIELLGPDYRPDSDLELDAAVMQDVVIEMRRFYK
jgi:membrane-anchored protein YejM (alkaline phosphatase superfamily)